MSAFHSTIPAHGGGSSGRGGGWACQAPHGGGRPCAQPERGVGGRAAVAGSSEGHGGGGWKRPDEKSDGTRSRGSKGGKESRWDGYRKGRRENGKGGKGGIVNRGAPTEGEKRRAGEVGRRAHYSIGSFTDPSADLTRSGEPQTFRVRWKARSQKHGGMGAGFRSQSMKRKRRQAQTTATSHKKEKGARTEEEQAQKQVASFA